MVLCSDSFFSQSCGVALFVQACVFDGLSEYDFVVRMGTPSVNHIGNRWFRFIVGDEQVFSPYKNLSPGKKREYAKAVVKLFHNHEGKFVKKDEAGNYKDVPDKKCVALTQELLRSNIRKERTRAQREQPVAPVQQAAIAPVQIIPGQQNAQDLGLDNPVAPVQQAVAPMQLFDVGQHTARAASPPDFLLDDFWDIPLLTTTDGAEGVLALGEVVDGEFLNGL